FQLPSLPFSSSSFLLFMLPPPPSSPLFPYTPLFRSPCGSTVYSIIYARLRQLSLSIIFSDFVAQSPVAYRRLLYLIMVKIGCQQDRKSTRLNSSHVKISYAVFCLKKKKKKAQTADET